MNYLFVSSDILQDYGSALLEAAGLRPEWASLTMSTLVAGSLRGVDSHGVLLLSSYLAQIEEGRVDPRAQGRVVSESGACLVYDGENGMGQVVAEIASDHAIRLAREHGLGLAVARESNHFGAAAWWAQKISREGMLGIVLCNASPGVPPWQGKDPRWGTNPICMAVPGAGRGGWLLDMATTTVAKGKLYKADMEGKPEIPPGWAMDSEGVPTTSTAVAMKGLLMPLGGYKGSGLAMMVEILCGVLGGGAIGTELGGLKIPGQPFRQSQFFLAIDVERLMPLGDFQQRLDRLVEMAKSSRPAVGFDEVLVAGDPEWRYEDERSVTGIPISPNLWDYMGDYARRNSVPVPALD